MSHDNVVRIVSCDRLQRWYDSGLLSAYKILFRFLILLQYRAHIKMDKLNEMDFKYLFII